MTPARSFVACVAALSLACASARPRSGSAPLTAADLLDRPPAALAPAGTPPVEGGSVLSVSPDMQAFLDRHVSPGAGAVARLRQLSRALLDERSFGLTYDETTRTASETFGTRRGNCLSFSNMFVAMARRVGLRADYQEVDVPPDWTLRSGVFVLNRHVNVLVDAGREGEHVVDFDLGAFRASYDRRRISDERALAHHENNVAVERLHGGDAAAFLSLRSALRHDPSFSPAWTNLGLLYSREGYPAHAEAAYVRALEADGGDLVAMSNLARLYERTGDPQRAARYRRRVTEHRHANPYYRFQLAQEALLARDYGAAIEHLEYAVRRRKNEDRFHFLLGLSYLGQGDEKAARKWFARAEQAAASEALRRRYADKVGRLLASPGGGDRPDGAVSPP